MGLPDSGAATVQKMTTSIFFTEGTAARTAELNHVYDFRFSNSVRMKDIVTLKCRLKSVSCTNFSTFTYKYTYFYEIQAIACLSKNQPVHFIAK